MRSAISVLLEKTAFGGNASLYPADLELRPFSRTSNDCLSTFCDTRGSKMPAILRDWQELDTEQAVSPARSTTRNPGERSGEHGG